MIKFDISLCVKNYLACCKPSPEVQTYLVKDPKNQELLEAEQLKAQLKGFNIDINFHELDYNGKLYVKDLLEKALKKL